MTVLHALMDLSPLYWLLVAVLVLAGCSVVGAVLILRIVGGAPRQYLCPQCSGTGNVGPTKKHAALKVKCPYCIGTGKVWR